ncbi:BMP family ABC transporter substrate-binding protein [Halobacteriales archaeon QS_8_69_26]|nr:MAG: BMP family ABC transporter substrate-binding protein [Halobacteriales archaeon QS_8_69_26]
MSREPDRRTVLKGVGTVGIGGILAGCTQTGGDGGDDGDGGATTTEGTTQTTQRCADSIDVDVGMVYATGGLGDQSFNDSAHRGVQRTECQLGISYQNSQPETVSEFSTLQRNFATESNPDYDLVCCIGFLQNEALTENADNYPDQQFMTVDFVPMRDTDGDDEGDEQFDNVASYTFKEHEGSFQVGHLAGLLTTEELSAGGGETDPNETKVGFVGGVEAPLIERFEAGYRAGVQYANENVDVSSSYAGDFSAPDVGKETALSMYDEGVDVIYHAAGGTGAGVFQAAREEERYAIGVDSDQSVSTEFGDVIVASMVKRVDNAVFTSIENVVEDNFQGGNNVALGLERGGVEAVMGSQLGSAIPQDALDALDESRQRIVAGEISVPTDPDDV